MSSVAEELAPVQDSEGTRRVNRADLDEAAILSALMGPMADADAEDEAPAPGGFDEPALPFGEWIAAQASWFRSFGTDAADWMARQIDDLANEARFHGASSPADFDDRRAMQDRWIRDRAADAECA
jgi:hypothetical protein